MDSIPGQEAKILRAMWWGQKKKRRGAIMGANKEELAKLQLKAIKLSRLPQAPSGVCATYVYPHLCTGHVSSPHREHKHRFR